MHGQRGQVSGYAPEVGLGTVSVVGGERYRFHCTAIADGSRNIAVGTPVMVDIGPAGPGSWEAIWVAPLADSPEPS